MSLVHAVVAYDVVDDARRNRLCRLLKTRLEHVQKSVFEGEVPERALLRLKAAISRIIDAEQDTVRIYRLCGRCVPMTEILGCGTWVEPPDEDVFV
ncbi:MAG: CRISPR-associated endonuclease Cas2 [Acidobacteria bacterium]|nr:MAG: CRISPR-associated endonuclease Cas2 [Acidobacteriota bacterium]